MGYHKPVSTPPKPSKHTSTIPNLDPALRNSHIKFEGRVTILALAAGFPGVAICAFLLWLDGYSSRVQWTVDLLLVFFWLAISANLKNRVVRPLQTLSNILAAIREGDYSIRGRRATSGDALGEVMLEVNDLGETLRGQRLGAMEATALLRTVMSEIDVAVFAFDLEQQLRLVNRAGEKLLAQPAVLGISGDPELRGKYGDLLEDQVRRIFADCAPFRLPAELYDTPSGGWKEFKFSYRVN